jgi:CheY-like chemotaxis protein
VKTDNHPIQILLLDDDLFILQTTAASIVKEGWEVFTRSETEVALTDLRAGLCPDIIIFDINIPGKDGLYFLETIKKEHLVPSAMLIASTNQREKEEHDRILQLGVREYINKSSMAPSELVEHLKKLLKTETAKGDLVHTN